MDHRGQIRRSQRQAKQDGILKQVMDDRIRLLKLRHDVACSLAMQLYQSKHSGCALLHSTSAEGYRVCRVDMGGSALLLAVRCFRHDVEVRYVYMDGRDERVAPVIMRIPPL